MRRGGRHSEGKAFESNMRQPCRASADAICFMDGVPIGRKRLKNENVFELIFWLVLCNIQSEFFRLAFKSVMGRPLKRALKHFWFLLGIWPKGTQAISDCA
jgi:hypothetical protein